VHIEKLRLDRFGTYAHLQIDSLTDGLNVFLGSPGTGKSTLVSFLRAMLHGFEPDSRRRFLPAGPHLFGGSVTVMGPAGRAVITRYDDGTASGRLTVHHDDGRLTTPSDLSDILPRISSAAFAHIYAVDFARRPSLKELWEVARRCGIDARAPSAEAVRLEHLNCLLRKQRDELSALPQVDEPLESLRQRRRSLVADMETQIARAEAELAEANRERGMLTEEAATIPRQTEALRREWNELQRTIELLESKRAAIRQAMQRADDVPSPGDRHALLQDIDAQLDRWRGVLREIGVRRQSLQAGSDDQAIRHAGIVNRRVDPRQRLRTIESRLSQLQAMAQDLKRTGQCRCDQIRNSLAGIVQAASDEVHQLCRELNTWEADARQRECSGELAQFARCESELEAVVSSLVTQRAALIEEIKAEQGDSPALQRWERGFCGCADHPLAVREAAVPSAASLELTAVEDELDRLLRRQEKIQHDLDELEIEASDVQDRIRAIDLRLSRRDEDRLQAQRIELSRVEAALRLAERREEIRQAISGVEREIEQITSCGFGADLLQHAAALLRRMSAGNLVGLQLSDAGALSVVDEHGTCLAFDVLTEGQRNLVYLSLCLQMITVLNRRGLLLPLVITGLFTHLESRIVPETAEVLRSFASLGQQIIVLTRFERVASVFRLLNVRVRQLDKPSRSAVEPVLEVQDGPTRTTMPPVGTPDRRLEARPWDAVETPDELTDRVRLALQTAPGPAGGDPLFDRDLPCSPLQAAEAVREAAPDYYLTENEAIEHAPSIDRANADRLKRIGILRVGDLLRVSVAAAASELRHTGITAEMIGNWQAQARLVCQVPGLRPYDARILAACGITTPATLRETASRDLREMVRDFAASPDGQAVLLSGTEYELARVTEWIKAPRASSANGPAFHSREPQAAGKQREGEPRAEESAASSQRATRRTGHESRRSHSPAVSTSQDEDRILRMPDRSEWRFYLDQRSPIVDAPSIGSRTAEQLSAAGIATVGDLLQANPNELAARLPNRRITSALIRQWQRQTVLACCIPQLRGHDAQILVAVGIDEPEQLLRADANELHRKVSAFVATKDGKRVVRNGKEPDLAEVRAWIEWASAARTLSAA